MGGPSKRTRAPAPTQVPSTVAQSAMMSPLPSQHILLPPFPSLYGHQSMFSGIQQPGIGVPAARGSWWVSPEVNGASAPTGATIQNVQDSSDPQTWGVDSHPPGGFLSFFKNTISPVQLDVSSGSASQPINVGDDNNTSDCARFEKRLKWTKEEDLRLVGAWLNNSNDPIGSNYKKNDQYWKSVAAFYNSTTPKNRRRMMKNVKDHFGRIKKRVAWFCGSWKEANALWASGESDEDLMKRAIKIYEEDHKKDGPFMFKHCWEVLRKQPKWDAYLERLEEIEPEKSKFNVDEEVGQPISLDDDIEERPMGGKQAKEQKKLKKKKQACVIDLENEINKLVDAQNQANEGRKEMLETQRRGSSENLEARKLAFLAAKEQKESTTCCILFDAGIWHPCRCPR